MIIDEEEIRRNVAARKAAEEILELADSTPEASHKRFWETLASHALNKLGHSKENKADVKPAPMTDDEAIAFERTIVPFGKYAGERVSEVPCDYWVYITESEFNLRLTRYLKSNYFQRRQEWE